MIVAKDGEKIPTTYNYQKDPCPLCAHKKGMSNKAYRGVKIPGGPGKCTRPEGLCSLKKSER